MKTFVEQGSSCPKVKWLLLLLLLFLKWKVYAFKLNPFIATSI